MRILVAEDDRITRASLVRQLEKWNHTVVGVEDGEQAWEQYGSAEFDIVVTDWEMPRLSGPELIKRIRASDRAGYVYLIILTGRSDKADIVHGIEAGADDFLSKPFDAGELRVRVLAGERVVQLERKLSTQNAELRTAAERMKRDLRAAARVQQAMLPSGNVDTAHVCTAWSYVPTDELAGDAVGFHLIDDRYLLAYVLDVCGHGVPAALLSVTAMHALALGGGGDTLLRDAAAADGVRAPAGIVSELNRRYSAGDNDGRFMTMILCMIDTHDGRLRFARAGHPLPILLRDGEIVEVDEGGGMPIGLYAECEYEEVSMALLPSDRICLYSDGFLEQPRVGDEEQFGELRLRELLKSHAALPGEQIVTKSVDALAEWAGGRRFIDDVSLVVLEWRGG